MCEFGRYIEQREDVLNSLDYTGRQLASVIVFIEAP